jgi:hypothetical protein
MSQSLAKHRQLEIVEAFNSYYIYLDLGTSTVARGMGSDEITQAQAERMLNTPYEYDELMEAYFSDYMEDD